MFVFIDNPEPQNHPRTFSIPVNVDETMILVKKILEIVRVYTQY